MCSIFVTPRNKSCQLIRKNVKAKLRELKIDIQLYEPRTMMEVNVRNGKSDSKRTCFVFD